MQKERLDQWLVILGLAENLSQAQKLVMAGQVRVEGQMVFQPALRYSAGVKISIDRGPRYVSRGGEKLEAGLQAFGLENLDGSVCVDVGASTGGFCDCLLQHGALRVYAVDVGYGELHWKLRNDPRVVVMERTNARHLKHFPEPVNMVSIDASFISLKVLLPVVSSWFDKHEGKVIALIKPQFEAARDEVSRGEGVIHDPSIHQRVLTEILEFAIHSGFAVKGLVRSPLKGPKGNSEFLVFLVYPGENQADLPVFISRAVDEGNETTSQENSTGNSI